MAQERERKKCHLGSLKQRQKGTEREIGEIPAIKHFTSNSLL